MLLRDRLPANACDEARLWLGRRYNAAKAWRECPRGDWMLWLLAKSGADHRTLVLAACDCARLALVHVPEGEDRPRQAIETAEAWARGEATLEDVKLAADAAYIAADAANAAAYAAYAADAANAAAVYAASAAGYAAIAAADAANAAAYAADAYAYAAAVYAASAAYAAAYDAAYAAAYAAACAARRDILRQCADLVRARFPEPPEVTDG